MLIPIVIGVLSGAVTAVSPCVLPVLPVIFFGAGSGRAAPVAFPTQFGEPSGTDADGHGSVKVRPAGIPPAARAGGPIRIVAGLVLSFAVVTLAGSLLVSALHLPDQVLRWAGLLVLFTLGLSLLVPAVQRLLQYPFNRFPHPDASRAGGPFVLGLALGALYVPCAGPVIAAIAIAGSTGQVDGGILVLTAAFAVGTAGPLLLFAYAGQYIGNRVSRTAARRFRSAAGVVMIAVAVALSFNLTDALQRTVPTYTAAIQNYVEGNPAADRALQDLGPAAAQPAVAPSDAAQSDAAALPGPALSAAAPADEATAVPPAAAPSDAAPPAAADSPPARAASGPVVTCQSADTGLANCGPAPALVGIQTWINTPDERPVTVSELKGKVVLVDFWTFACINCQHVLPSVTSWYDTYHDAGLEVIGVHTPEFGFERDPDNVRDAVVEEGIHYPVGLDNSSSTWQNYNNRYWPAAYLIDADGVLRYVKFGEGDYANTESLIRQLLQAADPDVVLPAPTTPRS